LRLLVDTHAFLWWIEDDRRLSHRAVRRIGDARNECFLSIASIWEIAIKVGMMRLSTPLRTVLDAATERRLALLPITADHALTVESLPAHHPDPFDRMLIAQAMCERLDLVSDDAALDAYPVRRIW
jgi:PIN domain nuclease of toxin-antitoxin system